MAHMSVRQIQARMAELNDSEATLADFYEVSDLLQRLRDLGMPWKRKAPTTFYGTVAFGEILIHEEVKNGT